MKICHITTVHKPKDARIFYRMCSALAAKGHEVTLIASAPFADEVGVHSSSWNERIAPAGRVSRIILALRGALSENADVYHFHDPELISLGLALKLVRPSATVVYDVHEDYPSMMLDKYWIPTPVRPLISKAARMANTLASLCLDGIVTADLGVQSDFQRIASERTLVYYNFPVLDVFRPSVNGAPVADLVYIGGMSKRTGMFVLLDALALLGREGIRPTVRLAGYTDGDAGRQQIVNGIINRKLEAQIDFRGRMPHSEVPNWIRSGRVGLVLLQSIPKFMKNIPTKMFEYWACGRSVIASDLPPIRQFCRDRTHGVLFAPSSAKSLADAIRYMLDHPEAREQMGSVAQRQVCDEWNNETQVEQLIGFYERALATKAAAVA